MDLFHYIQQNFLVYNISWEDIKIDKELLQLDERSDICMITGGGCNVLGYLLEEPRSIHTTDINFRQNALLEFKIALIAYGRDHDHTRLFHTGKHKDYLDIYFRIRDRLSNESRRYWDSAITFFDPRSSGFYFRGTCGRFAQALNSFLSAIGVRNDLLRLTREPMSVAQRRSIYEKIDHRVFNNVLSGVWKTSPVLSLLGVPVTQSRRSSDLQSFLRSRLYEIFVLQDPVQNPYWGLYLNGSYSRHNLPPYLLPEHNGKLKKQLHKVQTTNGSLITLLRSTGKIFSHFVLLDHMDWYSEQDRQRRETWEQILSHSRSGSRILLRSVEDSLSFFPEWVQRHCKIRLIPKSENRAADRVNTYAGTWLLEVV